MIHADLDWLMHRTLHARSADGSCVDLCLCIGPPQPDGLDWSCAVVLTGLLDEPRPIVGVDAWQAVQLAQQLLFDLLRHFVATGGQLLAEGEVLDPRSLFVQDRLGQRPTAGP